MSKLFNINKLLEINFVNEESLDSMFKSFTESLRTFIQVLKEKKQGGMLTSFLAKVLKENLSETEIKYLLEKLNK